MNETSFLRRMRSDVDEPNQYTVDRGRADLLREAWRETSGSSSGFAPPVDARRHVGRRVGFSFLGVGAATALTLTIVATNVLGLTTHGGGADAAAAATLESAAIAALRVSDPPLAPGQYLRIETHAFYGQYLVGSDGTATRDAVEPQNETLYIPQDRSADWVWERSSRFFDGATEHLRAPAGRFYGTSAPVYDLDSLPREPAALRSAIQEEIGDSGSSGDGETLVWIADRLRTGAVPADLRAAMYRVAAGIPGVTVTDDAVTLDGRDGIAIGRREGVNGDQQDIIIDPTSGAFIGERRWNPSSQAADDLDGMSAVTTTIVDNAPEGGTPNGDYDVRGCVIVPSDPATETAGGFSCPGYENGR